MKDIMLVSYGSNVSEEQLKDFIEKIPERIKSEFEFESEPKANIQMPDDLIIAAPKPIIRRSHLLINKNKNR